MTWLLKRLLGKAVGSASDVLRPPDPAQFVIDLAEGRKPSKKDFDAYVKSREESYSPASISSRIATLRDRTKWGEETIERAKATASPDRLSAMEEEMEQMRIELRTLEEEHRKALPGRR